MSINAPTALRVVALVALIVTAVPALAHEGQALEATTVLARVDGHDLAIERAAAPVALQASTSGRHLHLVDLGATQTPATAIDFELNTTQSMRLEVLDLEGNVVRTLAEGTWARGSHKLAWHHDSEAGEALDSGLYVVRLRAETERETLLTAR